MCVYLICWLWARRGYERISQKPNFPFPYQGEFCQDTAEAYQSLRFEIVVGVGVGSRAGLEEKPLNQGGFSVTQGRLSSLGE